jgi:hypothetical protein
VTTASTPSDPPYPFAWAVLACVLAALTLAHPALGGAFLVNPYSDQYIAGYAFREFAAASLRAGEGIPQWNPYLMGGMPYIAAMHGDIFYPTAWLRMILPTDVAMTWGMILHLMFAGIATYAFLRQIGLGFYAALLGGLAYMMSGQVASLVSPGHDGKLFVSALLPVTLMVLTAGIRDGRRAAWGLLALVVGLGVLSPHPQMLQYLLLASGAWALMLAFGRVGDVAVARRDAIIRLGAALVAVTGGMLIGAVQYLPVMEYVDWSPRSGGMGWDHAVSYSMPIEELINTYLPQFSGILREYWGRNVIHLHSEYLGAGVLFLAATAFTTRLDASRRRLLWFFTGVLVIATLWALGGNTPFYSLIYAIVPGTKFFRAPSIIFFVSTFAVAVLAAFGTERVLAGQVSRRWCLGAAAAGLAVAVLATLGVFQQIATVVAIPQQLDRVDANTGAVVAGGWRSFLFLAATIGVVAAIGTQRLTAHVGGALLAAVIVADLWSVERLYFNFSEPAAVVYASDPAIEHIQREPEPVRVINNAFGPSEVFHDPNLDFDGLMSHNVRVVLGYHGNEIRHYQRLTDKSGGYRQIMNPAVWGLLNVKYIYTISDDLGIPGATVAVGPVRTAMGSTVWLHQLPGEHPFAWVAPVIAKFPDDAVADAFAAPTFPYRSVALLPVESETPGQTLTSMPAPLELRARTTSYAPGKISIELDAPAPEGSALVVSENYYPGWSATVDGEPAKAERANLSLIAVALPAGARTIELAFDSAPYHKGRQVSLSVVGFAVLMLVAGLLFDRGMLPPKRRG